MPSITRSSFTLPCAPILGENPLPFFCGRVQDRPLVVDHTLTDDERVLLGFQTGKKVLPYKVQDRYTRDRKPTETETIVLENDQLRAVFLPGYGARLYSLVNKQTGQDVFYRNDILQPASLAQRNAWFSGGVEFNVGHYGHTTLTCDKLFAARVQDIDGQPFLRFYQFERSTKLFYSLDFYLPDGAKTLDLHVRVLSPEGKDLPAYCWINTAVPETPRCRVFSGTPRVIHILPQRRHDSPDSQPVFGAGELPHIWPVEGDCSFPSAIDFSCEYFFQYPAKEANPWEAVAYEDGKVFLERSTAALRYRKMFCWGSQPGGNRWQQHLTDKAGRYLEVQAGLAPTQLHGLILKKDEELRFTQSFSATFAEPSALLDTTWSDGATHVATLLEKEIPADLLNKRDALYVQNEHQPIETILYCGGGWGALECERLTSVGIAPPQGFLFLAETMGAEQAPWLALLRDGALPAMPEKGIPLSWMTDDAWLALLDRSIQAGKSEHWCAYLHLGVMHYEHLDEVAAREAWEHSLTLADSAIVRRCLAIIAQNANDLDGAIAHMECALALGADDVAFAEEILNLYCMTANYDKGWNVWNAWPEANRSDLLRIYAAECALHHDGTDEFLADCFAREYATLVEGENRLSDLWFQWQAKLQGIPLEDALRLTPPATIDYRVGKPDSVDSFVESL